MRHLFNGPARAWLLAALGFGLLSAGCNTTKPPGAEGIAAVHVQGHTSIEIARALSQTFQGAGFQSVVLPPNQGEYRMQFERRGSMGSTLVYGDWSSRDIWYRVKLKIERLDEQKHEVSCDVYRILHRGDAHFEEEHRLTALKGGKYQDLLNKAKASLEQPEAPSTN